MKLFPPPLVTVIAVLILLVSHRYAPQFSVQFPYQAAMGGVLICAALAVLILTAFEFWQSKTTISPSALENTSTLVTTGLYRFSRNPMYLALAVLIGGVGLAYGTLLTLLVVPGFILFITVDQIAQEEPVLRKKFGSAYEAYCQRTRRWI